MKKFISRRSRNLRARIALYTGALVLALAAAGMITTTASAHDYTPPSGLFCVGGSTVSASGFEYLIDSYVAANGGILYGLAWNPVTHRFVVTQTTVTAGACYVAPQIDRDGFVTADGVFLNLDLGSYQALIAAGVALNPAPWVEGLGEVASVPAGYVDAGYKVTGDQGTPDTTVANNIHEFYVAG